MSNFLLQVYLHAIEGHVPSDMVRAFEAYLDFCYLVRRNVLTEDTLDKISEAVRRFHQYREIFVYLEVRDNFNLPRQHAIRHYREHIENFGAPNGLCSSITESKHIVAVKKPWRRSSKNKALREMLKINERLDKLFAARVDFQSRGMLHGSLLTNIFVEPPADQGPDSDSGPADGQSWLPRNRTQLAHTRGEYKPPLRHRNADCFPPVRRFPRMLPQLGRHIGFDELETLTRRFVYEQLNPGFDGPWSEVPEFELPEISSRVSVFNSATAIYYAPSNPSSAEGMFRETIRSTEMWKQGDVPAPRRDCVLVEDHSQEEEDSINGLHVARVLLFFDIKYEDVYYSCALVHWYDRSKDAPDALTGMWSVEPRLHRMSVIDVNSILRGAHLLPVFADSTFVPHNLKYTQTLDRFLAFYLNKYVDHHAHEILS